MLRNKACVSRSLILFLCIGMGVLVSSCSDSPQPSAGPQTRPQAPAKNVASTPSPTAGAEYVGLDTCVVCHSKQGKAFRSGTHGAGASGPNACESCHGPGSRHVDGRGDKSKIIKGTDAKLRR